MKINRLSTSPSAYLQKASSQKIDWHPWSDAAFDLARKEGKPLFLSSGGVWCHWCHVMAQESFSDDEVADLLNTRFISIKLDRDERPDIDRRYQMAVRAMGQGGGWPLSVFLTPEKKPFFGGTYFPPEDRMGRPGFQKVLRAVIRLYEEKRDDVEEYTEKIMSILQTPSFQQGELRKSSIDDAVKHILSEYDTKNGGFGEAPKFPMSGAMELLINRFFITGVPELRDAGIRSLESMARGGVYDQLAGGFHRYSTDPAWIIPHFEKMADDNAWLLRNYIYAYGATGNTFLKQIAEETACFIRDVLGDPNGGFYASQDADVSPDDEGGYFTWTDRGIRKILDDDEYEVMALHFLHEAGRMHHDREKHVLFIARSAEEIAEETGRQLSSVNEIIKRAKTKLHDHRLTRETPFIDKTMHTSTNGMILSSLFLACRVLKDTGLEALAVKSLDSIMGLRYVDGSLYHSEGVRAMLDDYVYLMDALVSAYETTGNREYAEQAVTLMQTCISTFWDKEQGGFFDSEDHALGIKIRGLEDIPHPSANSICIIVLIKMTNITKDQKYMRYAEDSLKAFSQRANDLGISGAYFFCALDAYLNILKLSIHSGPGSELAQAARAAFHPYISLVYEEDMRYIIPCSGETCYKPISTTEDVENFILKKKYIRQG
ncbi:MAG: thioredoxin domain-containing protein [Nitrospiraceae bacterium]|nr:MAG: thioredoxin domain-containing protein [Nitrospiraceae bacterium]